MLNRKGFAITSILYGIMLLFLMVLLSLLARLKLQDDNLERSANKINEKFCNMEEINLSNTSGTINITKTCKYKITVANNNFCGIYYLKQGDSVSLASDVQVISNGENIVNKKINCN